MFAGHLGAALVAGRVEWRVNVGVFVTAALLLDFALWLFVLLGWESAVIPADLATAHQAEFTFPYSHGLLATVLWSLAAGALMSLTCSRSDGPRWHAASVVSAAVFSHWLLDALVHRPEMPLAGATSATVGLALWDDLPLAFAVEAALVMLGACQFFPGSGLRRGRAIGLGVLCLVMFAFTAIGMTVAPPPPSARTMAGGSLVTLAVVGVLAAWLGRSPPRQGSPIRGAAGPS